MNTIGDLIANKRAAARPQDLVDVAYLERVPGRPPFTVRQSDWVLHTGAVTTGAELPVFVDPRGTDVMIDWYTTRRA